MCKPFLFIFVEQFQNFTMFAVTFTLQFTCFSCRICIPTHIGFVQGLPLGSDGFCWPTFCELLVGVMDVMLSWILAGKQTLAVKQTCWLCLPAWLIHIKGGRRGEAFNGTHISFFPFFPPLNHCCGLPAAVYGKTWRQASLPPVVRVVLTLQCGQTCSQSALNSNPTGAK